MFILVGLIAGFIDSAVGGGGLITLPFLTLQLGLPSDAVGTNKIVGFVGALTAFLVYQKKNRLPLKQGLLFSLMVAVGSFTGSLITPLLPQKLFVWLMIALSPGILFLVLNRKLFEKLRTPSPSSREVKEIVFYLSAFFCGVYDGAFGPGGGTFMFLALLLVVKMPLLAALTLSKLANTFSAGSAFLSFASRGYVHYQEGLYLGGSMIVGAYAGSKFTTRYDLKVIRPMLVIVVVLLMSTLIRRALL